MKNLAPDITRQRLLIEGFYGINVDENVIREYFKGIVKALGLRRYGEMIVHCAHGKGKEINDGYDAFIPLIDSGISVYIWTKQKFLSVIIYTCKTFDESKALEFTKEFFKAREIESQSF